MAKKVKFNITGTADGAANKWAVIGYLGKLKICRFIRPANTELQLFYAEWMPGFFNPVPTDYNESIGTSQIEYSVDTDNKGIPPNVILYGRLHHDNVSTITTYNPTISFVSGATDYEIQAIPGKAGDFRLILKNFGALSGSTNKYIVSGSIKFTSPGTTYHCEVKFEISFINKKETHSGIVRFVTPWDFVFGDMDDAAQLYLCGPGVCDGTEQSIENVTGMPCAMMVLGEDMAEYVADIPLTTKVIDGNDVTGYHMGSELWETDFWAAIKLPNGNWRFGYFAEGAAYDGNILYI